jgi:HEAT repeat protein
MEYVRLLILELENGDESVRREAARMLGDMSDPRAGQALARAVGKDPEPYVRKTAAEALGKLRDPQGVPVLCAALRNRRSYWSLRQAAAEALGRIGVPGAVPALVVGLSDRKDTVCIASAEALARITDATYSPELRKAVRVLRRGSSHSGVNAAFRKALEKIEYATAYLGELPLPASPPHAAAETLPIPSSPAPAADPRQGPDPLSPVEIMSRLIKRALGD